MRSAPRELVYLLLLSLGLFFPSRSNAQRLPDDAVIRGIDAAVHTRDENVLAYTVTEHYSIFRSEDKEHPAAQVIVKTTYEKDRGKAYTIVSESGSTLILRQVIPRILENERDMTRPFKRAQAVINSSNYNMRVQGEDKIAGRTCLRLSISPRRPSPYLFSGKLWVDAADQSIVQFEGVTSRSPSMFAGASQVSRTYDKFDGYSMATHATAISNSWLLGRTTIQIDYTGYQITLRNSSSASR